MAAKVVFFRDFLEFSGGHQKVYDYYQHLEHAPDFDPSIYFTPASRLESPNPWRENGRVVGLDVLRAAPILFIGGLDWSWFDQAGIDLSGRTIINIIQSVRHADAADERFSFLRRPAFRICVSPQVADAIHATGIVNGPVVTIPNAVNVGRTSQKDKQVDVFVGGLKNPELALETIRLLPQSVSVDFSISAIARSEFLRRLANSKVAIVLPAEREGFFLPALEAMALSTVPVVPDCIGNRAFCFDGQNCVMPAFSAYGMAEAATALLSSPSRLAAMTSAGIVTAARHSIESERAQFLSALRNYFAAAKAQRSG